MVAAILAGSIAIAAWSSADETWDSVTLKDGSRHVGHISALTPGTEVVIQVPGQPDQHIPWSDVREIALHSAPMSTPIATIAGSPKSSASVSPQIIPKNGGKKKTDKQKSKIDVTDNDVDATYHSEEDCAESDDEDCVATTDAHANKSGVGLTYSQESVADVHGVKHGSVNFSLSVGAIGGFGKSITMFGGNFALSVRVLAGSRFPGRTGGSWYGVYFEPTLGGAYTSISVKTERQCFTVATTTECAGGEAQTSSAGLFLGTGGLGLQWMYFGVRDAKTKKQGGFGLALGGVAGYQYTATKGGGSGAATYGPQLSLIFPTYNAGTTSFSSFQVNFFVLPTKDFVFVIGGLQFGFG